MHRTSLSVLLLLLACVTLSWAGVHKVQLHKRESMRMQMFKQGKEKYMEHMKMREHMKLANRFNRQQGSKQGLASMSVSQDVYDYYDLEYVGHISVGYPAQIFRVILDTASSSFWVADSSCNGKSECDVSCSEHPAYCHQLCDAHCCDDDAKVRDYMPESTCDGLNKYNSSKSTSYKKDGRSFRTLYGAGLVDGFLGVDTMAFGISYDNRLIVPNTVVGQASFVGKAFQGEKIDGVLGLAFTSLAPIDGVNPPLINAISQKLLDAPMFTVWLETEGRTAVNVPGGVFTYGGLDTENCGPVIDYVPLTSESFYQFQVQGVNVGTKYKSNRRSEVISDTGTALIYGPKRVVMALGKAVGARFDPSYGLFMVDCDAKYDPITFTINNKKYELGPDVMTIDAGQDESGKPTCVLALVPEDFEDLPFKWVFGDPFIRKYCNIYDIGQKRIGFALAKHQKTENKN